VKSHESVTGLTFWFLRPDQAAASVPALLIAPLSMLSIIIANLLV
jgi:hypothetical protein